MPPDRRSQDICELRLLRSLFYSIVDMVCSTFIVPRIELLVRELAMLAADTLNSRP